MSAAQDGRVRIGESVSFGEAGAHQARAFHRWLGHPFTYPASLIFALRNDVPIGTYDLLSANRFLGDPLRPYGRVDLGDATDAPLIEDGWHGPEQDGPLSFRWAGQSAGILVPLDHAADLRVQVRSRPFEYPGAPPQTLSLTVNGVVQPPAVLPAEWTTTTVEVKRDLWRSGVNRVRLEFGRAARPADVGIGGDGRTLAAAVDYVRVEVIPRQ